MLVRLEAWESPGTSGDPPGTLQGPSRDPPGTPRDPQGSQAPPGPPRGSKRGIWTRLWGVDFELIFEPKSMSKLVPTGLIGLIVTTPISWYMHVTFSIA